jgi:hypothetical protein
MCQRSDIMMSPMGRSYTTFVRLLKYILWSPLLNYYVVHLNVIFAKALSSNEKNIYVSLAQFVSQSKLIARY